MQFHLDPFRMPVSTELGALLKANGVHQDVIDWLGADAQGCTSLKHFANWVEERGQLKEAVLEHTSQKDNRATLAGLKQAWREADSIVTKKLKACAAICLCEEDQ